MNKKTHETGGICTGVIAVFIVFNPPYTTNKLFLSFVLLIGAFIGSLLPDIDHRGSTISKKFKKTSKAVNKLFGHRGIMHCPLIYLLFFFILTEFGVFFDNFSKSMYENFVFGLFLGCISHLVLDFITVEGIPILYPISKKKFHLMKFKTGKNETLVRILMFLLTIALFIHFKK